MRTAQLLRRRVSLSRLSVFLICIQASLTIALMLVEKPEKTYVMLIQVPVVSTILVLTFLLKRSEKDIAHVATEELSSASVEDCLLLLGASNLSSTLELEVLRTLGAKLDEDPYALATYSAKDIVRFLSPITSPFISEPERRSYATTILLAVREWLRLNHRHANYGWVRKLYEQKLGVMRSEGFGEEFSPTFS